MLRLLPIIIVSLFLAVLMFGISSQRPAPYSKPVQKPLPEFALPQLYSEGELTDQDLRGRFTLLNIFASWCYTCRLEHDLLLDIAEEKNIPIYGVAWKDKPENTRIWLENLGNPYVNVASDWDGELVVPLGLTGTPETMLINPEGTVIYHHQGMLTADFFNRNILPLIGDNP